MFERLDKNNETIINKIEQITGVKYSDEQRAILNAKGGLAIIAAAGSGKTTVLTHLIAKRIMSGEIANPDKLLCTTYSKAGADEMSDRLNKLLKKLGINHTVTVKTIHASYYQVLKYFGLMKNICTNAQRRMLIKEACTDNKVRLEEDDMNTLDSLLSYQINYLLKDKDLVNSYIYTLEDLTEQQYTAIRQSYNKKKEELGVIDFDDMQLYMYSLLCVQKNQMVIDYCRSQWEYFYVDEFQDTSKIQFAIMRQMVTDPSKIMVIGDDDQCIVEGTLVTTDRGQIPIEDVQVGDWVTTGIGRGNTGQFMVDAVSKKHITGEIVVIKTKSGKTLRGTANHIGFARLVPNADYYYTYLMYKKEIGFRIGVTGGVRAGGRGELRNGIDMRLMQEKADKAWLLKKSNTKEEALYWESHYAYMYGIPMYRFVANDEGSAKTALGIETILKLHAELDTYSRGLQLLEELGMSYEYPHRIPQASGDRHKLNFSMFSSIQKSRYGMHKSELGASSSDEEYVDVLRPYLSTTIRKASKNDYTYYNSRSVTDGIDNHMDIIERVEEDCREKGIYLEVNKDAKFNDNKYMFMPLGNMVEGMFVPMLNGDTVEEDEIVSVTKEQYEGYVYDISVPATRNFVANDIVVHNCIYQWRGADPTIILNICAYYDIEKYFLNTNYRCGENIVKVAETGIKKMSRREAKEMIAYNGGGKIEILPASGSGLLQLSYDAYRHIKRELAHGAKESDICVLARNNNHVAILGNLLLRDGIYCTATEDMKISKLPLFKDLTAVMEMSKDTFNANLVRTVLWKVVPFLGLKGGNAVYEFMNTTGCSLKNSLGYILTNYCRRYDVSWKGNVKIGDRVSYKIEAMVDRINYKALDGLVKIYNILCSENELERVRAFLYMFKEGCSFLYGTQERMRTLTGMVQYFEYMCVTYGIDDTEAFLRLTEQYESGKMAVSGETITLSTIHGAKGMEWKYVIQFADDNLSFPSFEGIQNMIKKGISDKDIHIIIDGERRLHYVAQTRAIKKWTLLADISNISVLALEALDIIPKLEGNQNNELIVSLARNGDLGNELRCAVIRELEKESSPYAYTYREEVRQEAFQAQAEEERSSSVDNSVNEFDDNSDVFITSEEDCYLCDNEFWGVSE